MKHGRYNDSRMIDIITTGMKGLSTNSFHLRNVKFGHRLEFPANRFDQRESTRILESDNKHDPGPLQFF